MEEAGQADKWRLNCSSYLEQVNKSSSKTTSKTQWSGGVFIHGQGLGSLKDVQLDAFQTFHDLHRLEGVPNGANDSREITDSEAGGSESKISADGDTGAQEERPVWHWAAELRSSKTISRSTGDTGGVIGHEATISAKVFEAGIRAEAVNPEFAHQPSEGSPGCSENDSGAGSQLSRMLPEWAKLCGTIVGHNFELDKEEESSAKEGRSLDRSVLGQAGARRVQENSGMASSDFMRGPVSIWEVGIASGAQEASAAVEGGREGQDKPAHLWATVFSPPEAPECASYGATKAKAMLTRTLPKWNTQGRGSDYKDCGLPVLEFTGRCVYASTSVEADAAASALVQAVKAGICRGAGFDIEWKVTFQKGEPPRPAALIQFCPNWNTCYLFHISQSGLVPSLRDLLEDPGFVKAGVGAHGDALKLRTDFGIEMGGVCNLEEEANLRLRTPGGPKRWSLDALLQHVICAQLEKKQSLRTSDWEQWPLSESQKNYAATDAYASLRVYQALMSLPVPEAPQKVQASSGSTESRAAVPELFVPKVSSGVGYLQPAKKSVLEVHLEGWLPQEIASKRGIKESTVENYLLDAIQAGAAYAWHHMGISETLQLLVERALDTFQTASQDSLMSLESAAASRALGKRDRSSCDFDLSSEVAVQSQSEGQSSSSGLAGRATKKAASFRVVDREPGEGLVSLGRVSLLRSTSAPASVLFEGAICMDEEGADVGASEEVAASKPVCGAGKVYSEELLRRVNVRDVMEKMEALAKDDESELISYSKVRLVLAHRMRLATTSG